MHGGHVLRHLPICMSRCLQQNNTPVCQQCVQNQQPKKEENAIGFPWRKTLKEGLSLHLTRARWADGPACVHWRWLCQLTTYRPHKPAATQACVASVTVFCACTGSGSTLIKARQHLQKQLEGAHAVYAFDCN